MTGGLPVLLYMEDKTETITLRNSERTEDPKGHGDMSNTSQLESTCRTCNVPSEHPLFCDGCFDQWHAGTREDQVKARAERDARVAAYAGKRKMSPGQWVEFLCYFGIDPLRSFAHLQFSIASYWRWGCEMPFSAKLGDHPELELAMNLFSSQGPDAEDEYRAN